VTFKLIFDIKIGDFNDLGNQNDGTLQA